MKNNISIGFISAFDRLEPVSLQTESILNLATNKRIKMNVWALQNQLEFPFALQAFSTDSSDHLSKQSILFLLIR